MNDKNLSRFDSGDMTPAPLRNGHASNRMNGSAHHGGGSSGSSSEANAGIDVAEILDMLRRGKWIIAATTIVVVALVGAYTYTVDPVYEAKSIVKIDLGAQSGPGGMGAFGQQRDLASEVGVLQYSAELASRVVAELRATESALEEKGKFPLLYGEDGQARSTNEVMSHMMQRVSFVPMQSQSMIQFTVESGVPEEASTVANLYSSQYEIFSREKARASVTAARDFLETQAEKRREEIRELEQQWETFAQNNQVVTQGIGGERLVAEYTELTARRDALRFELEQEEEALRLLRDQLAQFEPGLRETVQQEQEASGLRSEISVLERKIGEMRAEAAQYYVANDGLEGDTDRIETEFPQLADLLERINGLEKRKRSLTNQLVAEATQSSGLPGATAGNDSQMGTSALNRIMQLKTRITEQEIRIGQIEAQIAGLESAIQSYEPRLNRIPQQTIQREQIDRKLQQAERFYQSITSELQKTIIAEESELGYVETVRKAFVPSIPVKPNVQQNLLLGLLLGVGFGIGLAFLRLASNSRIYRPDDLLRNGYRVTGVVPKMDNEIKKEFRGRDTVEIEGHELSTRLLPILSPWSPVTENYRLIRTNMQYAGSGQSYGEPPQTILVTSPEPGDGKTTTAINLALTFVLSGKKVLLIDADMRRPTAHKLLGMERSPGLAEMLRGDDKVQVVRRTYVDGLYFVPAGKAEDPPTEALDSVRMDKLIELGKSRCDIVIIDTPPVLAASDPLVLAPRADATLVVTSANSTDVDSLDLTRDMLEGVGVSISGVIFNRFDDAKASGSNYKYGYYHSDNYRMVS
ncbi:capsular biosynthesis protein [Longibacter salinarum]|uniref:non-specific protein-tyrosine kinase n=1 Tax=Longibacter salinarum TaxID=1850348 RepID=A0A2A8CVM9_9BACT|nr:polysaccharide biosynthesis tyrosine autokinase [Longibacter salinarum]PEN12809.1 capsular biosynthesis protein [Longibacter salinarum]